MPPDTGWPGSVDQEAVGEKRPSAQRLRAAVAIVRSRLHFARHLSVVQNCDQGHSASRVSEKRRCEETP